MTYGHWIDQARTHLRAAARELSAGTGPETAVDLLAVASSRGSVYRQLHRHVDLLAGPAAPAPLRGVRQRAPWPRTVGRADSGERMAAAFRDELRIAAGARDALPPASPTSQAGQSLGAAANCLAIAADVLATHVGSGERPRTPEGAAIRAGGGVPSALADLARVAFDTIHIDLALPAWLDAADDRHRAVGEQVAAASRQATTSVLPSLLRDLIAAVPAGQSLLHGLNAAPVAGQVEADVRTVDDAAASLQAVRTWLWQNPTQHHGIHLRLGTQLGLVVTLLAGDDPADHTSAARTWRRAASVAADVEGSAPTGEAEPIADTLAGVLRWTRNALDSNERPQAGALTAQLPALAEALFAGVAGAVERGDVFVNRSELTGRARSAIVYAKAVWRRARMTDAEIRELRSALGIICRSREGHDLSGPSPARSAFQRPPRPGSAQPPQQQAPAGTAGRRRGRS